MKKRFLFLTLLFMLVLSACSNTDALSGKTFALSERSSPASPPDSFYPKMTLQFSDGKVFTKSIDGEEGKYVFEDDKLTIQFENENEKLEIEFTLEESELDFSSYSARISDATFEMQDSTQVSKYKNIYLSFPQNSAYQLIEK